MLNLRSTKNLKNLTFVFIVALIPLFSAQGRGDPHTWDEVLLELADLRHELKAGQVDFDILREKLAKPKAVSQDKNSIDLSRLIALEKKFSTLEGLCDKLTADVRTLNQSLTQISKNLITLQEELSSQNKLLEDVGSLKGTLSSLSKAMNPSASSTYQVKAGDSLSLIAKKTRLSIEEIKRLNPSIKDDKIRVGQELKISHATP